jgi:hypothetical protein
MGGSADGNALIPRGSGGEPLTQGRRMTQREARSWMKRRDVLVGRGRCGTTIEWVPEHERAGQAARVRQDEGMDCNVQGDVLLFRVADGRPVLVIEEPCQGDRHPVVGLSDRRPSSG